MSDTTAKTLHDLRTRVINETPRIRAQGSWPAHIADTTLISRLPGTEKTSPGFDAGIACALDLIPRDKQKLASTLHAAYTETAVEQLRAEIKDLQQESETCWWLAACGLCKETPVSLDEFVRQLGDFDYLAKTATIRMLAAYNEREKISHSFQVIGDIPFAVKDGGLQGAYISGYDWGIQYSEADGLFFIGTFRESLGLEDFPFSNRIDVLGRPMSGPIHGSRQFVKACSIQELESATFMTRAHLGSPKK